MPVFKYQEGHRHVCLSLNFPFNVTKHLLNNLFLIDRWSGEQSVRVVKRIIRKRVVLSCPLMRVITIMTLKSRGGLSLIRMMETMMTMTTMIAVSRLKLVGILVSRSRQGSHHNNRILILVGEGEEEVIIDTLILGTSPWIVTEKR
jgi:hypothetical protein